MRPIWSLGVGAWISLAGCLLSLDGPVYRAPSDASEPPVDVHEADVGLDAPLVEPDASDDRSLDASPDEPLPDAEEPDTADVPDVAPDARDIPDAAADAADGHPDVPSICAASCTNERICCAGACVDRLRSEQHCGGCNRACPTNQVCDNGTCRSCAVAVCLAGADRCCLLGAICTGLCL